LAVGFADVDIGNKRRSTGLLFTFLECQGNHSMRILGVFHRNRVAAVLILLGSIGFLAGCGGDAPVPGGGGITVDSQAKQDAEKEARLRAYGKSGIPPDTKKAAEHAPKL
jgi:hypothetical protein